MFAYSLLDKQKEFMIIPHNYPLDVVLYQGGFGSGKTWCGSLLGILLACKYPGSRGLVGAKEYELVRKTTLVSYFEHLNNLGFIKNKHYYYNKIDKIIKFNNGSEILFSALDDPEKFKSLNLHWAEIEEASQIDDESFKQLLGRLRNTHRGTNWPKFTYRLFAHSNPQLTKGWIYKRFVENKQENYRLIIAPSTNNTFLPSHFVSTLKEDYDEEYFKVNVLGEFGDYSSGLVVKGFKDDNLLNLKYCDSLPLHISCDFNVDPMCWVLAYTDNQNIFFFDELVIEKTTTQDCINELIKKYPNHKSQIIINGDASGDNRSTQSKYTNYAIIRNSLKAHGYNDIKFQLRPYNPPILSRIQAFNAKIRNSSGVPHLFIDARKCKWLMYNIRNLSFKEGTSIIDLPSHVKIMSDKNSKFLEHPFDAASYLVEYYWRIK